MGPMSEPKTPLKCLPDDRADYIADFKMKTNFSHGFWSENAETKMKPPMVTFVSVEH